MVKEHLFPGRGFLRSRLAPFLGQTWCQMVPHPITFVAKAGVPSEALGNISPSGLNLVPIISLRGSLDGLDGPRCRPGQQGDHRPLGPSVGFRPLGSWTGPGYPVDTSTDTGGPTQPWWGQRDRSLHRVNHRVLKYSNTTVEIKTKINHYSCFFCHLQFGDILKPK